MLYRQLDLLTANVDALPGVEAPSPGDAVRGGEWLHCQRNKTTDAAIRTATIPPITGKTPRRVGGRTIAGLVGKGAGMLPAS